MDWDKVAADAVTRHENELDRVQRTEQGQREVLEGSGVEDSGPAYYVYTSDWPIRSKRDLPADTLMSALRGLSDYYDVAMTSLRNTATGKK